MFRQHFGKVPKMGQELECGKKNIERKVLSMNEM